VGTRNAGAPSSPTRGQARIQNVPVVVLNLSTHQDPILPHTDSTCTMPVEVGPKPPAEDRCNNVLGACHTLDTGKSQVEGRTLNIEKFDRLDTLWPSHASMPMHGESGCQEGSRVSTAELLDSTPRGDEASGADLRPSMIRSREEALAEYYGALLRQEQEQRHIAEEKLKEERLALLESQVGHRSRMQQLCEDRARLLQEVDDKTRAFELDRMIFRSKLENERSNARREKERLLERVRQAALCERSLLKDVSSLLLQREAWKKGPSRIQYSTPQTPQESAPHTPQRSAKTSRESLACTPQSTGSRRSSSQLWAVDPEDSATLMSSAIREVGHAVQQASQHSNGSLSVDAESRDQVGEALEQVSLAEACEVMDAEVGSPVSRAFGDHKPALAFDCKPVVGLTVNAVAAMVAAVAPDDVPNSPTRDSDAVVTQDGPQLQGRIAYLMVGARKAA